MLRVLFLYARLVGCGGVCCSFLGEIKDNKNSLSCNHTKDYKYSAGKET